MLIDNFIKDTIYNAILRDGPLFLEWVSFNRFKDIKQIGEGGFVKVFSATWIDGNAQYTKRDDGSWIKKAPESFQVALKWLNGSQNMSADYLNELKTHWSLYKLENTTLTFYGMTKDPKTEEFMMIMYFANDGNLRNILSNFHSRNILKSGDVSYISVFGLSGPSNEQKLDNKICGVLPYVSPEVLNGEPYTLSSDIYSFGVVMAEVSSGKPPFYNRKHDTILALEICNGLRPEFGKGTPEIYKKLAHRCMNANPNQRPTANELYEILKYWYNYSDNNKYGYKVEEVEAAFQEADKEIPNISISYEKDPDVIYSSRIFTFKNLSKPINSSLVTKLYLNEDDNEVCQDPQLIGLEISNSLKLNDDDADN
ncbi:hypothetical protein RclHR1_15000003 [Rhizophagus clarus]|uniref:Protein kinase domain-containing protein n=1 Tax=Rhizophagus clarus TaxID=94130 RepID=A0A2Z6QRN7_9GLOM|nr:hypothetical protein RclHR1_15000003 [Rhizophagus clarus]